MRYYGGKDKLLDLIEIGVKKTELNNGAKFVDLFSGTTVVAQHFKKIGYMVIANDFLEFSYALAKTYIELNEEPKFLKLKKYLFDISTIKKEYYYIPSVGSFLNSQTLLSAIDIANLSLPFLPQKADEKSSEIKNNINNADYVINYLNNLRPKEGFIFENYCPNGIFKRKYFSDENGQRIDAIRETIEEWKKISVINELEYYYLITALLEAVNRVSNVAGTYGAYLKTWDQRAIKPLILTKPKIIHSIKKNKAYKQDANKIIKEIRNIDILYLDPPYNNRQYSSNYFILELVAEGWFNSEKPILSGKTGMIHYSNKISEYCYKERAEKALENLIDNANTKYILLSYNNEGIIPSEKILNILNKKGDFELLKKSHKRYKSVNQDKNDPKQTEEYVYFLETPLAKKRANKLDGRTWLQNSFSIWQDINKNSEETKLKHPAIFPIQLCERIIDILTNGSGKNILDCFAGSGSTLIAGLKKGMNVYGVDISDEFRRIFLDRLNNYYSSYKNNGEFNYYVEDAKKIHKLIKPKTIDLCLTSPPYWDILNERRTADLKIGRNYTDNSCDIGNIETYNVFIEHLKLIMIQVAKTIRNNGYCVMVVMDIRKAEKLYPFHSDIMNMMREIGFSFEDLLIWNRQKEYNNCKPLGYPYKFVVNKIHEYILIFKKNG